MSKLEQHLGGHCNQTHTDLKTLTYLRDKYNIKTMIDVGCGPGDMVTVANENGVKARGIDGDHTLKDVWDSKGIDIMLHDFVTGNPVIDDEFDLAWSVEFLEHVDEEYQESYMSVFRKCKYVVCTAAPPGAPGHHHVNCRDEAYWVKVFDENGFDHLPEESEYIRSNSDMKKPFIQRTGRLFKRR
ncbi:methyltransferase domain-containing protein [candidate division WWE3 bacterium]|jgi:SAM-dependent methyltransferase|nr:methyltransferase domain-containing protein [candidate division WWE3 bacterium]